ncbi:MAG: acyl carrier protein [Bacteroidota bacterium]
MDAKRIEDFLVAWTSLHLNKGLPVDPASPLSTYGIDSIRAILLSEDTQNKFGFEWPPSLFFEDLTIEQLAVEGVNLMQSS